MMSRYVLIFLVSSGLASSLGCGGRSRVIANTALGYPPDHKTPSLDTDRWVYWNSKMGTFDVNFVGAALGHPPDHETPSTQAAGWQYWRSRLDTFTVHFRGNNVSEIKD